MRRSELLTLCFESAHRLSKFTYRPATASPTRVLQRADKARAHPAQLPAARRADGDTGAGSASALPPSRSGVGGGWGGVGGGGARRPAPRHTRQHAPHTSRPRRGAGKLARRCSTAVGQGALHTASHARDDLHDRDAAVADLDLLRLARGAQEGERRVEHLLLGGEGGEEADVRAWSG